MKWSIEYEQAYERWVDRADFEDNENNRVRTLQLMADWASNGPPPEIDFDSALDAWSADIPGTAVKVEYIIWRETRDVFVVDFHSAT